MHLLHSKSILDCISSQEREHHGKEIQKILDKMALLPNYRTILRCRLIDKTHSRNLSLYLPCYLNEVPESIDGIDCENEYDFVIQEDNFLTIIVYGQFHLLNNAFHIVETHVDVLTFDKQNKFINILPYVELNSEVNLMQSKKKQVL